jgi:hypothetical protein
MTSDEATLAAIDALESSGVGYMLVGSLSSNLYGIPRSTQDADFVVQLSGVSIVDIARRMGARFRLDPQMSFETVTGTHRYVIHASDVEFKIELFLLSDDPHDRSRFARRRPATVLQRTTYVPTAEDVIIMKLRWSLGGRRSKDIDDLRSVLAVQGEKLDWDYIHSWCDQHVTRELLDQLRAEVKGI